MCKGPIRTNGRLLVLKYVQASVASSPQGSQFSVVAGDVLRRVTAALSFGLWAVVYAVRCVWLIIAMMHVFCLGWRRWPSVRILPSNLSWHSESFEKIFAAKATAAAGTLIGTKRPSSMHLAIDLASSCVRPNAGRPRRAQRSEHVTKSRSMRGASSSILTQT
ncbi:hypothetical protein M885DRAFT_326912 [Pelagophyceae sp. CCMP2097]|nr:hypothetical protein M885DRAFT_326912 [Pelagophyceae sp. CCMP2097]